MLLLILEIHLEPVKLLKQMLPMVWMVQLKEIKMLQNYYQLKLKEIQYIK